MSALSASSAPARSIEATARSTSRCSMTSEIGTLWTSTSNIERSITSGFSPWLIVRLPCGSRSMSSTRCPISPSATPRLSVVVVFATPPFWFASAMTCVATRSGRRGRRPAGAVVAAGSGRRDRLLGLARRLAHATGSGSASSGSGSGSDRERGRGVGLAGRGRRRMSPMTTPRSPRSTRLLHATFNPRHPSSRARPAGR